MSTEKKTKLVIPKDKVTRATKKDVAQDGNNKLSLGTVDPEAHQLFMDLCSGKVKTPEDTKARLEKLSDEQIQHLNALMDPHRVNKGLNPKKKYTCLALLNMRQKYIERMVMTGMIGFLYKMNSEMYDWEHNESIMANQIMDEMNDKAEAEHKKSGSTESYKRLEMKDCKEEILKRQKYVQDFLNINFKYNPEIHVREAFIKEAFLKRNKMTIEEFMRQHNTPIPPIDVFHRFRNYYSVNYEEIRNLTEIMYCERADIDEAICVLDTFDTPEEVENYRKVNDKSFITSLISVTNGAWTLTGPFKENRNRIDYYNEKTALLKEMVNTHAAEEKVGREMVKNRIKQAKERNIKEFGSEPEGLDKYMEGSGRIEKLESLGVEPGLSKEERKALNAKYRKEKEKEKKDVIDIVDEKGVDLTNQGVEVNVFHIKAGGREMEVSKFETLPDTNPGEQYEINITPGSDKSSTNTGVKYHGN